MEQLPTPMIEILVLMLFLGSITYLLGAGFQIYFLLRNRIPFFRAIVVIVLTRVLTVISSYFIWVFWHLSMDFMFLVIYLPAVLPELILSPLMLRLFGIRLMNFPVGRPGEH